MEELLSQMDPISLDEMSAIKLMNRIDTKFLLNQQLLQDLAQQWPSLFYIQEIDGKRIANYKTLYFDTQNAITYTAHHNQQLHRQKIRQREYVDSGTCYCEIKNKVNTGRTKKNRIGISQSEWGALDHPTIDAFVKENLWITQETLYPRLQTQFQRITLVNRARTERITIDQNLRFQHMLNGCEVDVPDLVVVEVKQDGRQQSDFKQLLQEARIQPKRISKYVLGMLLTDPSIKYNRFKSKIRYINNLINPHSQTLTIISQ